METPAKEAYRIGHLVFAMFATGLKMLSCAQAQGLAN